MPARSLESPFAMLAAVGLAACAPAALAGGLVVHSVWIKEGPPGLPVLAGYIDIENGSDRPRALLGLRTPDAEQVMIHQTEIRGGVAGMHAVESLEIPPHGRVALKPGGAHLMLMHPRRVLKEGDTVALELLFDGDEVVKASAPVRRDAPPADP